MCMTKTVGTADHLLYHEAQKVCVLLRQRGLLCISCTRRQIGVCMTKTAGTAVYLLYLEEQKVCV